MKTTLLAGAAILAGLGLAVSSAGAEGLAADEMGLSKTSVFDTPVPPAPDFERGMPGSPTASPLPAAIPGGPPQIPHAVADFLPVTVENNACLGCHSGKEKIAGLGTPMPDSHYRDLRTDPEVVNPKVDGSRYICTTCHAPQASNPDLVQNTFAK
jgi:cytochrome c-type protein NapB